MALDMKSIQRCSWVWVQITLDEYESLTKNLSKEEIEKNFKQVDEDGILFLYKKTRPDENELDTALTFKSLNYQLDIYRLLLSIKSMLKFFVVLTIIGLCLGLILGLKLLP